MKFDLFKFGFFSFGILGCLMFYLGCLMNFYDCIYLFDWEFLTINSGCLIITLIFDYISLLFVGCVFLISSMVIYYSHDYMVFDVSAIRFYFLVILFVFSMMMMIFSPNLISILIGWDGLGLVSYCLVVFFNNYKSYSAGMLTILTNRLGDIAILLSVAWMMNYGSWYFMYYSFYFSDLGFIFFYMLIAAGFTKSAQLPFSSWLPAAMAAPTPVSSLVHSSTLVTAGVYLLIRFSNSFMGVNLDFFLFLSVLTMFISGLGAILEFDLKSIIALSTLSQLGLMMSILFMNFPLLCYFHLLVHAFFKALLFLCAGLIIHCLSGSQDVRHMGCMSMQLPFTSTCFCISTLSLCGMPFMSGFYSKDLIMEMMMGSTFSFFIYFLFMISLGFTVIYSLRLIYYCFSFNINLYVYQSYYEGSIMMNSLILLGFLSIFGGSLLCWLLFTIPSIVILPFSLKIGTLLIVFLGSIFGYFLGIYSYGGLIYSYNYYLFSFFCGSMWFLPSFSTHMLSGPFFFVSKGYYSCMDSGWGEYFVSKSFVYYYIYLGKYFNYYYLNNFKVIMLTFFLFLSVLLI
uniref:NADH-ubiquinone oxidoreductase chain 5 n=1 Tax=Brontostoma colossus TaxID=1532881 RepID=A0A076L9F0_9HEMI|nr:NADH dehydrogenase subunit 5 [Brontostoma colossus]AIJ02998.1 NADH dehydrogenase subunit 5 [Brontostoma colossus]